MNGFLDGLRVLQLTGGGDEQPSASHVVNGGGGSRGGGGEDAGDTDDADNAATAGPSKAGFLERSRYIPLRLSADERRLLHLLEAALSVSSYTDKVRRFISLSALPLFIFCCLLSAYCRCLGTTCHSESLAAVCVSVFLAWASACSEHQQPLAVIARSPPSLLHCDRGVLRLRARRWTF